MDAHFETITHSVINHFLERVSNQSSVEKDKLWQVWKEMFNFPNDPKPKPTKKAVTKPSTETKPQPTEVKAVEPAKAISEVKSETVPEVKVETVPEVKAMEVKVEAEAIQKVNVVEAVLVKVEAIPETKTEVKANTDGCTYKFTRGDRTGQECGKKKKTDLFCTTHSK